MSDPDIGKPLIEQLRHLPVTRGGGVAAHYHPDQSAPITNRRRREIEAACVYKPGFDAVEPRIGVQQMIMVA